MTVLVNPNITPVCLIVKIIQQMLRHINGLHVLHIDAAQRFIVPHTGIKFKTVQVLREVDEVGHAGSVLAAVNHSLEFLQIALIQFGKQAGQMVELVKIFVFRQIVIEPQHIPVKARNEKLLIPHTIHADAL